MRSEARGQRPEVGGAHASRVQFDASRVEHSNQPFFRTEERVAHLLFTAELWRGTPWCANSDARGPRGGVSCHNLPRAIYLECGALRESFPKIVGDPNASRHATESAMEKYIDARPEFLRLLPSDLRSPISDLRAGDLLGLRIYNVCDHLGLYLGNGVFVHVLMHKNTDFDMVHTPPWQQRIIAAWRLLDLPL